jgi:hypothetical protein
MLMRIRATKGKAWTHLNIEVQKAYFCDMKSFYAFLIAVLFTGLNTQEAQAQLLIFHNAADTLLKNIKITVGSDAPQELGFRNSLLINYNGDFDEDIKISDQQDSLLLILDDISLEAGGFYHLYLSGLSTQEGYQPNPSGSNTSLRSELLNLIDLPSPSSNETRVIFVHGATDMPTIKIGNFPGPVIVESLSFGNATAVNLPSVNNNINIISPDSTLLLATYALALQGRSAQTVVVLLSGFISPLKNREGLSFLPLIFGPGSNTGQALPNVTSTQEQKSSVLSMSIFPNPTSGLFQMDVTVSKAGPYQVAVADLSGRMIQQELLVLTEGRHLLPIHFDKAPSGTYLLMMGQENKLSTLPFVLVR